MLSELPGGALWTFIDSECYPFIIISLIKIYSTQFVYGFVYVNSLVSRVGSKVDVPRGQSSNPQTQSQVKVLSKSTVSIALQKQTESRVSSLSKWSNTNLCFELIYLSDFFFIELHPRLNSTYLEASGICLFKRNFCTAVFENQYMQSWYLGS